NPLALVVDIAGVVDDRQSAHHRFVLMERQRINIDRSFSQPAVFPGALALRSRLLDHPRFTGESRRQSGGYGDGFALRVIDSYPGQVFPAAKPINHDLEILAGALAEIERGFD